MNTTTRAHQFRAGDLQSPPLDARTATDGDCKSPARRVSHSFLIALLALATASPLRAQTDDLMPPSDEFTSAATLGNFTRRYPVEGWGVDRLIAYDINTTRPGALVMVPRASGWYQDYEGELAFRSVTGDFVVTADVGVTNVAGNGAPGANYSFAGLLVRTPRPSVTSLVSPQSRPA